MLDIIINNPYRLLGIYSNSPTKERVANHNRLKAFLKVGKELTFPLDLPNLLPAITRSEESLSRADANLTLPDEQLRYAQFWFMKAGPLDDIAMNHLVSGNVNEAISIWEKKDTASSLQNRMVCALISDNRSMAFDLAEKLYSRFREAFASLVLGECHTIDAEMLEYRFLDELCTTAEAKDILSCLTNKEWEKYVRDRSVRPLTDMLQSAIDVAKSSKGKGSGERYTAGARLINDTKEALTQLKSLLTVSDLQYQMIADKLGLEILQCGIDYYNGADSPDAAHKAMELQSYAHAVVVGKMAKDRCKENVDILQKIIDNLPPREVFAEDKAIKEDLSGFCRLPDKICHAVTLLNNTKPHLQSIKEKLGATNAYYLKMSTLVVNHALSNIIEEVNDAQKNDDNDNPYITNIERGMLYIKLIHLRSVLESAWNATKLMDTFDMEPSFKTERYNANRSILKNLCERMEISTPTIVPRSPARHSATPSQPASTNTSNSNSTKSFEEEHTGCLIAFIAWIVIGCIAGAIFVAEDGDFAAGFALSLFIVGFLSKFYENH